MSRGSSPPETILAWKTPDPRQDWDDLLFTFGPNKTQLSLTPPDGWSGAVEPLSTNASLHRLRLQPANPAEDHTKGWLTQSRELPQSDCGSVKTDSPLFFGPPSPGDVVEAGQGALVYTAGFWENGTLFYTNIPKIHESDWPRAYPYAWDGSEALPVYVYESSRTERPSHWAPCTPNPPTDGQCAWSYFTTIEGFNEALKGLSTNAARVVHIPPEKAYTLPGKEDHDLYGDALVFYIRVFEVHEVPCFQEATSGPRPPCEPLLAFGLDG